MFAHRYFQVGVDLDASARVALILTLAWGHRVQGIRSVDWTMDDLDEGFQAMIPVPLAVAVYPWQRQLDHGAGADEYEL